MACPAQTRPRRTAWRASLGALLSLGLGAGFGFGSGCYAEREPPPTYRYQCGGDGDCEEGEACREGICERLCTQATFEDDCGSTHVMCFNGACSNTCEVGAGVCPSVQECVDLSELGIDIGGGSSNPFGGGGDPVTVGVCGRKCSDGDGLCPDGETCLPDLTFPGPDGEDLQVGGFCVGMCDATSDDPEQCGSGFVCLSLGFCVPESFDDSSSLDGVIPPDTGGIGTSDGTSGDDSSGDAGDTDMTTGDDTTGGGMTGGTTG